MKRILDVKNALYPMLMVLVGAQVHGRPNFLPVAHVGIMDFDTISFSLGKTHYTNAGIRETGVFSVNIPSAAQMEITDYCGLVSGARTPKDDLFELFYGQLGQAPMIAECPICMECRLVQTVEFPRHEVFMGEIVETYVEEGCLTDGVLDYMKVDPMLFTMSERAYYGLGRRLSGAWKAGKGFVRPVSPGRPEPYTGGGE